MKQYKGPTLKWFAYCKVKNIDPYEARFEDAADFLAEEFSNSSKGYSSMNTARSALSAILKPKDGFTFGKHPLTCRILKGMFRMRPSLPKYTVTYDVSIVLNFLADIPSDSELDLPSLTFKLATLMLFLSGKRSQIMEALALQFMFIDEHQAVFYIAEIMKESRPGFHTKPLEFQAFPYNSKLCMVSCLSTYLERTTELRSDPHIGRLFLSPFRPFNPVKNATIASYVRNTLSAAKIDLTTFGVHSTRSSSTSKAAANNLSLVEIYKAAGWANAGTFQKFYKKDIVQNFGNAVLAEYIK